MNNVITVNDEVKNDELKADGGELIVRIKYPRVLCESGASKKVLKLCKNMNSYYSKAAMALYDKANSITSGGKNRKNGNVGEKYLLEMNYKVAIKNDNFISIVVDIGFEDKRGIRKRRFSQNWSVNDGLIVPAYFLLKMTYGVRKKVYSYVLEKANKNAENHAFGYYADFPVRLRRNFSLKRFFITEKGFAFYFDAGVLSDVKHGSFAFVIPYKELDKSIKNGMKDKLCRMQNGNESKKDDENCVK